MYWRLTRTEFEKRKGAGNRRALRRIVSRRIPPGVLAYAAGRPIGWCAVAPREEFPKLDHSRVLARVDAQPVWSVPCLFVARPYRNRGVSVALLGAAVEFARKRGAKIVEGYPTDPQKRMADAFAWTGLANAFRRAGFTEVARHSPTRPIMRVR